jgi:putative PIN family toxin of toxin-antitoxin system
MIELYAVIDTNSAISYYLGNKSEAHAAVDRLRRSSTLLASEETLAEFQDVILREKFARIPLALRASFLSNYQELVTVIRPRIQVNDCIDPKDNKFLSLAISGDAQLILTSDQHLLRMNPYRGIRIVKPEQFLAPFQLAE